MSHDSRQLKPAKDSSNNDRFIEQFSGVDSGLSIQQPKLDWTKVALQRRARRRISRSAGAALVVLLIASPVVWYANHGGVKPAGIPGTGSDLVVFEAPTASREAIREELLAFDRELSQLERSIVSLKRKDRVRISNRKKEALLQANPAGSKSFADPIEEGALVLLAAAEKAAQKDDKDASLALFRRLVEIFPDTRSADIARRELM
jgi:hypothetical protein